MISTIVHPKQLEKATVRIACGGERGSGFFVGQNLLLTAWHVVQDHKDESKAIEVMIRTTENGEPQKFEAKLVKEDFDMDVALIALHDPPPGDYSLPVSDTRIRYDEEWETFGWPSGQLTTGGRYHGKATKTNSVGVFNIELSCNNIQKGYSYGGLSGSAVLVRGKVVGVIISQLLNDHLGAISVGKLRPFLSSVDIPIAEPRDHDEVPDELRDEAEKAVSNNTTLGELEKKLCGGGGKFYLLYGSPGSGKTVLVASFHPRSEGIEIVGRYFVRLPKDPRPLSFRASNETLLQWLEFTISNKLSGAPPPHSDLNVNERTERLSAWLQELNRYYHERNIIGIIIIDGLDDVSKGGSSIETFLAILPENLPSNIAVVLSCTTTEILPAWIKSRLDAEREIRIAPLDPRECEAFVFSTLQTAKIKLSVLQTKGIVERSEGHPLYLHYLVEYVRGIDPEGDIDKWLEDIPDTGGDIRIYYERVWEATIAGDADKVWIALTISQLRQPVDQETLILMTPTSVRYSFLTKLQALKGLLKTDGDIETYHSSFAAFLEEKGGVMVKGVHDNIIDYCENHAERPYAITNCLFHQLKSSDPGPAVRKCSQLWADKCALISVEPELVISDIKRVEDFCIDQGEVAELIRIKLLLQRIRFRYNQILAENAYLLADALIALEKPQDAIKYLLRNSFLMVGHDEALYFLQKLYEEGSFDEADALLNAIRTICTNAYDNWSESGGIASQTFILHINSITLSLNRDFDKARDEYFHRMQLLKKLEEHQEDDKEQQQSVSRLREYLAAWNAAYLMWRYDFYVSPEKLSSMSDVRIDNQWTRTQAIILNQYNQFLNEADRAETTGPEYDQLRTDVENLIQNYGYEKNDAGILIAALLRASKRADIVAPIVLEYLKDNGSPNSIRKENGADPSFPAIGRICDHELYSGYVDEKDEYPTAAERNANNCDDYLISLLRLAGFVLGKAYRLRADGRLGEIKKIEARVDRLLNQISFTLADRIRWDRSYGLPEAVLPTVLEKIVRFALEFNRDRIESLVDLIASKSSDQLGLYTEGFRECLYAVARMLSRHEDQKKNSYRLITILDNHVDTAVQNRLERAPALLRIVKLYCNIGNRDRAWQTYQRMLNTSMGPSWYKEDQLGLISTSVRMRKASETSLNSIDHFAGYLKFASGEMTFQRYVRHEKQELLGSLSRIGHLDKAIEYFKFELLPDTSRIIDNAESSEVDTPRKGDGYVLGAHEIDEAPAIVQLISGMDADPAVLWALTEVFIVNNDVRRHLSSFAEIQAEILNRLRSFSSPLIDSIRKRLIELVVSEGLNAYREEYLTALKASLSKDEFKMLQGNLLKVGINYALTDDDKKKKPVITEGGEDREDLDDFSFLGMGRLSNLKRLPGIIVMALQELDIDNKEKAKEILVQGLEILHQGKSDIWMGKSLSGELGKLFDILRDICTPEVFIRTLKMFVANHHTNDWRVVDSLIEMIGEKLNTEAARQTIEAIKEHIYLMIRPDQNAVDWYSWLKRPNNGVRNQNEELYRLLIWLLNHPYHTTKKRVVKSIRLLALLEPAKIVPLLLREALDQKPIMSSELSALVLAEIARDAPHSVWESIKGNLILQEEILNIGHFMIKQYFLKTLSFLNKEGDAESKKLHERLAASIPKSIILQGEIGLNEPYLRPVKHIVDVLNELLVLTEEFRENLVKTITDSCKPLSIADHIRADLYVRRSFFDENTQMGRYHYLLRHAINCNITPRVDRNNIKKVEDILRLPYTYEA